MEKLRAKPLLKGHSNIDRLNRNFEGGRHGILKPRSFHRIGKLGKGAFGVVDKFKSAKTGKVYAAKIVSTVNLYKEKMSEQFLQEINILMNCDHPNIVKLYAAFEHDGKVYLIMEYASRGNLYNELKKSSKKKFSEEKVAAYFRDILAAFEYLHSKHPPIIHRDLKPENILIDENWRLKIADFGWSREQQKERTTFCGTPDYLAPEMIDGSEQTEKLDIWTMGVLMYELLHGKPPFAVEKKVNPINKINNIQKKIKKGLIKFGDEVSEEARHVIRVMLSPEPLDRPIAIEVLTLPFFTKHYPILASLNVKSSMIGSKMNNSRSRVIHEDTAPGSNIINGETFFAGNMDKIVPVRLLDAKPVVLSEEENIPSEIKIQQETKERDLNKMQKGIEAEHLQVKTRRASLDRRARGLAEQKAEIGKREARLTQKEKQTAEREKALELQRLEVDNMNLDLVDRNLDLEAKERELGRLAREVDDNSNGVGLMEARVKQKIQDLEQREREMAEREENAKATITEHLEKTKLLERREMELGELEQDLADREQGLLEKERETISDAESEREESRRERESVKRERGRLGERREILDRNEGEMEELRVELESQRLENEERGIELQRISQQLVDKEIELNSKSKGESHMKQIEESHSKRQAQMQEQINTTAETTKQLEYQLKHRRLEIARLKAKISRLENERESIKRQSLKTKRGQETKDKKDRKEKKKIALRFKKKKIAIPKEEIERLSRKTEEPAGSGKNSPVKIEFASNRKSFGVGSAKPRVELSDNALIIAKQEKIIRELNEQLNKASIISIDKSGLAHHNQTAGLGVDLKEYSNKLLSIIDNTDQILKTTKQTDPKSENFQPDILEEIRNMKRSIIDFQGQFLERKPQDQTDFEFNLSRNAKISPHKISPSENPSYLTGLNYTMDSEQPSAMMFENYPTKQSPSFSKMKSNESQEIERPKGMMILDDRPSMYLTKKSLTPIRMTRRVHDKLLKRPAQTTPNQAKSPVTNTDPQSLRYTPSNAPDLQKSHQSYPTILIQKNVDITSQINYIEPETLLTKKKQSESFERSRPVHQDHSPASHLRPKLSQPSYLPNYDEYESQPKNSFQNSVERGDLLYGERGEPRGYEPYQPYQSEKMMRNHGEEQRVAVVKGSGGVEVFMKVGMHASGKKPSGVGFRERERYNPNLYPTLEANPQLVGTADQPLTISGINQNLEQRDNKGEDFFKSTEDFMKWKDTQQWESLERKNKAPRFPEHSDFNLKQRRNSRGIEPKVMKSHDQELNTLISGGYKGQYARDPRERDRSMEERIRIQEEEEYQRYLEQSQKSSQQLRQFFNQR